jgi:hypothetical protein
MATNACANVEIRYKGDGSTKLFPFPFTYIRPEDIYVSLWDNTTKEYVQLASTEWSFANATTIEFKTAPVNPPVPLPGDPQVFNVKISRSTKVDRMLAQFYPGSAIRAEDLNDDFEQLRLAIEEQRCQLFGDIIELLDNKYWNKISFGTGGSTMVEQNQINGDWQRNLNDKFIATTDAIAERYDPEVTDTLPTPTAGDINGKTWYDTEEIVERYWDDTLENWITVANTGPVGPKGDVGNAARVWFGTSSPTDFTTYPLWLDTRTGILYAYYNDGDSTQWISTSKAGPQGLKGDKGDKGDTGLQGLQGIQGFVGPQGPAGLTGPQGIQGDKGDKGDKGDTGDMGPQGLQGIQGPIGLQGIQGLKGDKGDTGSQGIQGPKGDKGDQGIQGIQGIKGDQGIQGVVGPVGPKGDTGLTGPQGIQGIQGPKGDKGDQGEKGATGDGVTIKGTVATAADLPAGAGVGDMYITNNDGKGHISNGAGVWTEVGQIRGPQGLKGDKGDQGIQGLTGPQGPAGPAGADSTVAGPQGPKGDTGLQGPQGVKGDTGATGPQGPQGTQGLKGDKGDTGPQGPAGLDGAQGPAGATGPQGLKGDTGATGPAGPTGPQGPAGTNGTNGADGAAATIAVGTVTAVAAGGTPTVTNAGSANAAVFNFGLVTGATGAQGPQGIQGPKGDPQTKASTVDVSTGTDDVKYITSKALFDADRYIRNYEDDATTGTLTLNASTNNSFQFPKARGTNNQCLVTRGDGTTYWGAIYLPLDISTLTALP